jgi:hypothetical protein
VEIVGEGAVPGEIVAGETRSRRRLMARGGGRTRDSGGQDKREVVGIVKRKWL